MKTSEPSTGNVVICERPESAVCVIRIDRPERRNALSLDVKQQLDEAFAAADADLDVRVIVLTGGNSFFVGGTDIVEMVNMTSGEHTARDTSRAFRTIAACRKPVIAAVEGYALGGGCELALACDMIVAGRGARFGQPEIRVGIMPGAGGTQRLLRTIGKYQAMKMILTGEPVDAEMALAMGLVSELADTGAALERALARARDIASMPPLAVRAIKEVVNAGQNLPLDGALLLERKAFQLLFDTSDQEEGMRAFLEKRHPVYRGA
jgi:enoyl-CoA hydratase/carnithine racemase